VQLPAIQYGDWKTVKKRMARIVTQLKRGADFVEVMTADGMLDTETTPGMLAIFGIIAGPALNFHCFMPWRTLWHDLYELREKAGDLVTPPAIEDAIFAASLCTSWGVLGLLAHDSQDWLIPASRHSTRAASQPFAGSAPRLQLVVEPTDSGPGADAAKHDRDPLAGLAAEHERSAGRAPSGSL
jgi:hypothetical protein